MKADLRDQAIENGIWLSIENDSFERFMDECRRAETMLPRPTYHKAEYALENADEEGYFQMLVLYFERVLDSPAEGHPTIGVMGKFAVEYADEDEPGYGYIARAREAGFAPRP